MAKWSDRRGRKRTAAIAIAALAGGFLAFGAAGWGAGARKAPASPAPLAGVVRIEDAAGPVNRFRTDEALGAGVDGSEAGGVERFFRPATVARLRTAGLAPMTYRLRTELAGEAWHWNPQGRWSDAAHAQGYWTSDPHPREPIDISYGYRLPRRGDSIDQANDDGYSRIDDGDPVSFWKSNPYLDPAYAGAAARPQWVKVDLGAAALVDTARIAWGEPYARAYAVQYWTGEDEYDRDGRWADFPGGGVTDGRGGEAVLALTPKPVKTRFLRLVLKSGSGTAAAGSGDDPRDRLGFAVRELKIGRTAADGAFADAMRHAPDHRRQSLIWVSSTDPWHRAGDRDPELEQPGLDLFFRSGVTNGLPALMSASLLYGAPEDAAGLADFLAWRRYPARGLELGEEPDGQYVDAEAYAELYRQAAVLIRRAHPGLLLGGPSLQSAEADTYLDDDADHSWTRRFIRALRANGALGELGFFSFERYPFDNLCGDPAALLRRQPGQLRAAMARLRADEVPPGIPWLITEYGFSAYAGRAEVELPSALLHADMVGGFLSGGGAGAYLFGYGPNELVNQHLACAGEGNLMLFQADDDSDPAAAMPAYWGARMEVGPWAEPGHGEEALYAAAFQLAAGDGSDVGAYALKRPDGRWAVLLVNRSDVRPALARLKLASGRPLAARLEGWRYSPADYAWDEEAARPSRDRPPETFTAPSDQTVMLPPLSLTVLREER